MERVTGLASATRLVARAMTGVIAVMFVAWLGFVLKANFSTVAFLHLLIVVLTATWFGFWPASVTSLVAVSILNYFFLPPLFSFRVDDPQNWVALIAFESTALIVSRLSAQVQLQTRKAILERSGMEKLYELSRRALLLNRQRPPGGQIVRLIHETIGAQAVALFDATQAKVDAAGSATSDLVELARNTYFQERDQHDLTSHIWQKVLRLGSKSIGAIVFRDSDLNALIVDATASLTAIALDRANSFDRESRAEAARQSEQLRTTVLDSLAHAFKTPLTAIRTASSGLLEACRLNSVQTELATLIDEESVKLNELTSRLLKTASLEASETQLRKEEIAISQFIEQLLNEHSELLGARSVQPAATKPDVVIFADRGLLATTLTQFLDNAVKYSPPGSPITIAVAERDHAIVISVHNEGSVVSAKDRERIFDRFYRSPGPTEWVPGTGLGLAIAKKAAEAHRGRVWVSSEEGAGTTFFLSLPRMRNKHEHAIT